MKRSIKTLMVVAALCLLTPLSSQAQSIADCLEQLALDYQKLAGLKSILKHMYTGYEILSLGYRSVTAVSQGNFNLHEAFLDALLQVSPAVRSYPRAADIIRDQQSLLREYRQASRSFSRDPQFKQAEISTMLAVYNNLAEQSLQDLSELSLVLSDGKVRMSDAERLAAIDRIYITSQGQLTFLRNYNDRQYRVSVARAAEQADRQTLQKLYGLN